MNEEWKEIIETAWKNRNLLDEQATQACIRNIIEEIRLSFGGVSKMRQIPPKSVFREQI